MKDPAVTLDRLTARAGHFYSLPSVAVEVLKLTEDPRMDTRKLKECVENDPALTGKLLRVVNSSLFGFSREVSDLNQALALLGTKPLKLLVLGFSLPSGLFSGVRTEILGWYWRHTLTRAVAAREIAETVFDVPGDEAFIAGLLQDLGLLMLIQQLGEPYVAFLEKVLSSGRNLAVLETEYLGFDHTAASARLLTHWGLPDILVRAIAAQPLRVGGGAPHTPEEALPQILCLAELLAQLLADGRSEALSQVLHFSEKYEGLHEIPLEALVEKLEDTVRQLADVLSLQLPDGRDYRDVLVQAHTQLSEVAAETATAMLRASQGDAEPSEEDGVLAELRLLAQAVAEVSQRTPEPPRGMAQAPSAAPTHDAPSAIAAKPARTAATATAEAGTALLRQLTEAAAACRRSRLPLSLLLIQLDHVAELKLTRETTGFNALCRFLETTCRQTDHPCTICTPHGEAGFALVLPDCERRQAVELANQLIADFRRGAPGQEGGGRDVTVSIGVAAVPMPPKNFVAEDLFTAADRCLYGAIASGGAVVKSIEIY